MDPAPAKLKLVKGGPPRQAPDAAAVRNLLKLAGDRPEWDEKWLCASLGLTPAQAAPVVAAMQAAGYIEPAGKKKWRNTPAGNVMAGVTAAKPIKRATAQRKLDEFQQRLEEVNRNSYYLFRVERAVLFGSFLRNEATVKELDIALRLEPKERRKEKFDRLMRERAAAEVAKGKRFSSWQEQERWGEQEVLNFLKSRGRGIELHSFGEWVTAQPHRDLLNG